MCCVMLWLFEVVGLCDGLVGDGLLLCVLVVGDLVVVGVGVVM